MGLGEHVCDDAFGFIDGLALCLFRLVRHTERYQTITGKDFKPRRIDLGAWRYLTCGLSLLLVFLITGLPFIMMLYASLMPRFQPPTLEALRDVTLVNYRNLLTDWNYSVRPLWNSTLLGVGSASVVMLLVAAISYFVNKSRIRGRKILDFLGFAPIALPSVVLGTAFLWFYLLVPLPVIGSLSIIGLAYLTRYMPYALRFVSTSMVQIHSELEEAAAVAGGTWWKNLYRITFLCFAPGSWPGGFGDGSRLSRAHHCPDAGAVEKSHRRRDHFRSLVQRLVSTAQRLRRAHVSNPDRAGFRWSDCGKAVRGSGASLVWRFRSSQKKSVASVASCVRKAHC